jgi:hypothetical protein
MSYHHTLSQNHQLVIHKCDPYTLFIGVICGSAKQIQPLLEDINRLSTKSFLQSIGVHILLNGETEESLGKVISQIYQKTSRTTFNIIKNEDIEQILPIGSARSVLQKELGHKMDMVENSIVWILDDDMRIPEISERYLTWLPQFKSKGIDVLIGNFEGGSPNPPAHGIRVQLNDLLHNLIWFDGLNDNDELPGRSAANASFRAKYPDYYYDLSRKHIEHLNEPYWVIPSFKGESVLEARIRVVDNLDKILTGEPFLRPLIVSVPSNPIDASIPSCNRGGNTFVLNSKALTLTPNAVLLSNGTENRRSDMIWAIINRYYHQLNIRAVSFPVYHNRYLNINTEINLEKTVGEIRGSALYAALQSHFDLIPNSSWNFLVDECDTIHKLYQEYIERRLTLYEKNFKACNELLDQLDSDYSTLGKEITDFTMKVRKWVSLSNLENIRNICDSKSSENLSLFLKSIQSQIEKF